jgi:hypothetical protein
LTVENEQPDYDNNFGLDPGAFYRWSQGFKLFGLKHTQLSEAIKTGKLPPPLESVEGGKAKGWTGTQIIEHRRTRLAAANAALKVKQAALKAKQLVTAE